MSKKYSTVCQKRRTTGETYPFPSSYILLTAYCRYRYKILNPNKNMWFSKPPVEWPSTHNIKIKKPRTWNQFQNCELIQAGAIMIPDSDPELSLEVWEITLFYLLRHHPQLQIRHLRYQLGHRMLPNQKTLSVRQMHHLDRPHHPDPGLPAVPGTTR